MDLTLICYLNLDLLSWSHPNSSSQILPGEDLLAACLHLCFCHRDLSHLSSYWQVNHQPCSCQLRRVCELIRIFTWPLLFIIDHYCLLFIIDHYCLLLPSTPVPIWEIPFPALTLCNMNKVSKTAIGDIIVAKKKNIDVQGTQIQGGQNCGRPEERPDQPLSLARRVLHWWGPKSEN